MQKRLMHFQTQQHSYKRLIPGSEAPVLWLTQLEIDQLHAVSQLL